jgi:hypothetical protein
MRADHRSTSTPFSVKLGKVEPEKSAMRATTVR